MIQEYDTDFVEGLIKENEELESQLDDALGAVDSLMTIDSKPRSELVSKIIKLEAQLDAVRGLPENWSAFKQRFDENESSFDEGAIYAFDVCINELQKPLQESE